MGVRVAGGSVLRVDPAVGVGGGTVTDRHRAPARNDRLPLTESPVERNS